MENIYSILNTVDQLIEDDKIDQIEGHLKALDRRIKYLETDDNGLYGYFKYLIASYHLKQVNLNQKQKIKFEDDLEIFKKDFINEIEKLLIEVSNTASQQPINYQLIKDALKDLENKIKILEDVDQKDFYHYKYLIADKSSAYLELNQAQKKQYDNEKQRQVMFYKDQKTIPSYKNSNINQSIQQQSALNLQNLVYYQNITPSNQKQDSISDQCQLNQTLSSIVSLNHSLSASMQDINLQDNDENRYTIQNNNQSIQQQSPVINELNLVNNDEKNNDLGKKKQDLNLEKNQMPLNQSNIISRQNSINTTLNTIVQDLSFQKQNLNDLLNKKSLKGSLCTTSKHNHHDDSQKSFTDKVYLLVGQTGVGKSSLIQRITGNTDAVVGHGKNSETRECMAFFKNSQKLIDSPGINDTQKNRYEIFLSIAKYMITNKCYLENCFIICVSNKKLNNHKVYLQELAYTYFLYELFQDKVLVSEVKKLVEEYFNSSGLLNWSEVGYHQIQDDYTQKRIEIFKNRDRALDYIHYVNSFYIVVKTFFDQTEKYELKKFDKHMTEFFREQIWVNKTQNSIDLYAYKDYIEHQEDHLFQKIQNIIKLQYEIQSWNSEEVIQHILLIGESQVGKSSLIEQLKGIKGLRGSGKQSETQFCQMYLVKNGNVKYFFIDTPGFEGSEANQNPVHNLKIIADFLRRNRITEFKILYMRDAVKDVRDRMDQILSDLFFFIQQMFDQDTSFIDSAYLREIFCPNDLPQDNLKLFQINSIKEKILSIERVQKRKNKGKVYLNDFQIKSVEFKSNYFRSDGTQYVVKLDKDRLQQDTLFEGIQEINPLCVDDKIIMRIQKVSQFQIIDNLVDFMIAYKNIEKKYKRLYKIQNEIRENNQLSNQIKHQLQAEKLKFIRELNDLVYNVIGDFFNSPEIQQYIMNQIPAQSGQDNGQKEIQNKLQNDIQKHFLKICFTPFLFEADSDPKNVFFSRKQLYFWSYFHQLKPIFKKDNNNHIKILEDLAKIKTLQEICLHQHLKNKQIHTKYEQETKKIVDWIEVFVSGMNTVLGTGAQIYRYATYFSNVGEATLKAQSIAKGINVGAVWANCILAAVSIGIDIYSYSKGQICGNQFALNTSFNYISLILSIVAITVPGIGWIVGGIAGSIALIGYGISAICFTSSTTYDNTIGLLLKTIIDFQQPNSILLYFQKSQMLQKYNLTRYTQIQSKDAYKMFRELSEQNFLQEDQKSLLQKLFPAARSERLLDHIAQHISQNIILNHIQFEQQQLENERSCEYLLRLNRQRRNNKQIIETFYNRYKDPIIQQIEKIQSKLKDLISKKKTQLTLQDSQQRSQQNQQNNYEKVFFTEDEILIIKKYSNIIKQFQDQIRSKQYSYQEYIEFGDGYFRKGDRFPITFNSYCNLAQQKRNLIYEQRTISEISKNEQKKCFKVLPQNKFTNSFLKFDNDQQIIDSLNLLTVCDKFVTSRYLLKIQGQEEPNLSFMSESEVIDCEVAYSIDLYEQATISENFNDFLVQIKAKVEEKEIENEKKKKGRSKKIFEITVEQKMRLRNFYVSIQELKKIFI